MALKPAHGSPKAVGDGDSPRTYMTHLHNVILFRAIARCHWRDNVYASVASATRKNAKGALKKGREEGLNKFTTEEMYRHRRANSSPSVY